MPVIASCTLVHITTESEARARGLFADDAHPVSKTDFMFAPSAGFYLVPHYAVKERQKPVV